MDPRKLDAETREYFNSLPPMVQEDLLQTGAQFSSREELQRVVEQLLRRS